MIPGIVREWCQANGYGDIVSSRPVGGGCINHGMRLATSSGKGLFLKTNPAVPADMFQREAEGLEALRQPDGPRIPTPFLYGAAFLLLEDLAPAPGAPQYWPEFGRRLAALHAHIHDQFGFPQDNYIGSTPQPNPWTADGFQFFADQRLLFQTRLAHNRQLLPLNAVYQVERLAARLPELIPVQPASLIHGDLWSGNATADAQGKPAIIDPAAHWGWAEAELGMTALFGGFTESFYRAYNEARPLTPGWRERFPIYNLYHLLNHVNLFGSGYLGEVQDILRRYG